MILEQDEAQNEWAALTAQAVRIAATVHENQRDKNGAAYILHPLRLLLRATTPEAQVVAVLHDVIEDDENPNQADRWTPAKLRAAGFSPIVTDALDLVTKRPDETGETGYAAFIERIAAAVGPAGIIARQVKLLDLEDNLNLLRLTDLTDTDIARLRRYRHAHRRLS